MKTILTSIMLVLSAISAFGATPADSVKVYFLAGRRLFDPSLGDNRAAMDAFVGKVLEAKTQDNIEKLIVSGYASPEGASDANQRLSGLRCSEIANYISKHTGIDRNLIFTNADGVAWTELRNLVAQHTGMPEQKRVLYILDHTPLWVYNSEKTKIIDGRKKQLMELDGGRVWSWMMENLFPELRNAVGVMLYLKHKSEESSSKAVTVAPDDLLTDDGTVIPEGTAQTDSTQTDASQIVEYKPEQELTDSTVLDTTDVATNVTSALSQYSPNVLSTPRSFYMAVKNNMLYDGALVPNLGAEFYLGKNLSLYGEWMYAWWDNDDRHRYWRVYGGDIGLRWWLGKKAHSKPLTGHHLGIYGGILTFDFETGDTGYMGGKPGGTLWDRWMLNTGIEYGYSLPVAKRLNIDFSIGIGYLGGNYIKYYPFDNDYYFDKEYSMHYFGPTKVEISLVWLIGRGNTNSRKGGGR